MKKNGFLSELLKIEDYKRFDKILRTNFKDVTAIEEFYECMKNYWDDSKLITHHMQTLLSEIVFDSKEEVQKFLDEYLIFYNKVGQLLDIDNIITVTNIRKNYIRDLARDIINYSIANSEDEKMLKDILKYCLADLRESVKARFDIKDEELEEAKNKLIDGVKCDKMFFYYITVEILLKELDEQECHKNFFISSLDFCVEFSNYLNMIRKEAFEEINSSVSFAGGKPARNDLCPCGSGKKYKKCCLLKN